MIEEMRSLLDQYSRWLRDRTILREAGDKIEITTPYLDRHNDYLQIYARKVGGGFLLTDDSYVLEDLELSGCRIDTPRRKELFTTTLNGFGVRQEGTALEVRASADDFALRKHNLVQAMLAVNDLFYLASSVTKSLFHEDVADWLEATDIRYTPRVKFSGRSGYDHLFDFVIPKSRSHPERIVRTINHPNRDTAQAVAFSWIDTKAVRAPGSRAYALVNDAEQEVPENVLGAMRAYDVSPIPWSSRENAMSEFAA